MVVVLFVVAVMVINLAFVVLPAREVRHLVTSPIVRHQIAALDAQGAVVSPGRVATSTDRMGRQPIILRSMPARFDVGVAEGELGMT